MNIKELETLIADEIDKVVVRIIKDNKRLNISAKARAGAEISDWLEDKFVEYTREHQYLKGSESAPKGSTKNPWDARTYFAMKTESEEIWIDFKAFKVSSADSNPDIGTPDKIINFIRRGSFYMLYIYVYYQEYENGLEFVKLDGKYTKTYFLKDISSTVRRNPKNQLQINISVKPEYRSREEFIRLLIHKIKESHQRQIKISEKKLKEIDSLENELIITNKVLLAAIEQKIL